MSTSNRSLPVHFVPHGGGPWPFVRTGFATEQEEAKLAAYLRSLAADKPQAVLCVSAHWEAEVATVMSSARPSLFFDYYGFPPESYKLVWDAPGAPALASQICELLDDFGFATALDARRGFDHGAFVPLMLAWPRGEVPTLQLSLIRGLDPGQHLALGRALAPLRKQGVLIVGSGMTYHNLRAFGPSAAPVSETFDEWLRQAVTSAPEERARRLERWQEAPAARLAHPREEHLLPLMVAAGAAEADAGRVAFRGTYAGLHLSGYEFGRAGF